MLRVEQSVLECNVSSTDLLKHRIPTAWDTEIPAQYTSEMFKLVENRLFIYADDSTLLAVIIHKTVDRPAVSAP